MSISFEKSLSKKTCSHCGGNISKDEYFYWISIDYVEIILHLCQDCGSELSDNMDKVVYEKLLYLEM